MPKVMKNGVGFEAMADDMETCSIEDGNLDNTREHVLRFLSESPSDFYKDPKFSSCASLAAELLIKSFLETKNILIGDDSKNNSLSGNCPERTKFEQWESCLELWHEIWKHLRNLEGISCCLVEKLLDCSARIVHAALSHCKRSEILYGREFDNLRPRLTSLFRTTYSVLEIFLNVLQKNICFVEDVEKDGNVLKKIFCDIAAIAVLMNGMDLKILSNVWRGFEKLAVLHKSNLTKLKSTESITNRFEDIAKDIDILMSQSFQKNIDGNYKKSIVCSGFLLKILGRLCTIYHGYCGNKVSIVLVELLTKLHRYLPPFPCGIFVRLHSKKIAECSETQIVPATADLLNILISETDFAKAFFRRGKAELEEKGIFYHLLTLKIIEQLSKSDSSNFTDWLQRNCDQNIIDVAISNMNHCREHLLRDTSDFTSEQENSIGKLANYRIYENTRVVLCQLIGKISSRDLPSVESALLKHLLNSDLWCALLSCDLWTYLASISPVDLCHDHLLYLGKIHKVLTETRGKSLETEILMDLIARLYRLLPVEMQENIFRQIDDDSRVEKFANPLRKMLASSKCDQFADKSTDNNLGQIFQALNRSPSLNNWNRLTHLLRSMGAITPKDKSTTMRSAALRDIWEFVASRISKAEGLSREMLLDLTILSLDCTQPDSSDKSGNDRVIASIYRSIFDMIKSGLPTEHRLRINIFLRENLEPYLNESGTDSLKSISELFCRLVSDGNPWVRQESFETYGECIVESSSEKLFRALSIGVSQSPSVRRQMPLYLSKKQIHTFSQHPSLEHYIRRLVAASKNRSSWHKCYQPDFPQRDAKTPRLEIAGVDTRIDDICDELQDIIALERRPLNESSVDKLRTTLLQLLDWGK